MPLLRVYVSEETLQRLKYHQRRVCPERLVEDMAEAAIAEAALDATRHVPPANLMATGPAAVAVDRNGNQTAITTIEGT